MFKNLLDNILNFDYPWNGWNSRNDSQQVYFVCQYCGLPITDNLRFAAQRAVCTCLSPVEGIIKTDSLNFNIDTGC